MAKSLVGRVKNEKFAFFWLLIGGSIGNIFLIIHAHDTWPVFLPSIILSISIALAMVGKTKRFKVGLGVDLLLTLPFLLVVLPFLGIAINLWALLPDILIIFGCILGVMNW